MGKYQEKMQEIVGSLGGLRNEIPEVMQEFAKLNMAAGKDGELSKKFKELIALGIAISGRCEECLVYHIQTLIKLGVTKPEILETLGVAVYMGGGPSVMYAGKALKIFEELS